MTEAHAALNVLAQSEARAALARCCGSVRWVDAMLARRPFADLAQLMAAAEHAAAGLTRADLLQAFSQHPQIGADLDELRRRFQSTAELSAGEQAGAAGADAATLRALRDKNQAYLARFGYIFIVCATGKSAAELLALLEQRLHNDPETELAVAAGEQLKISKLRLSRIT